MSGITSWIVGAYDNNNFSSGTHPGFYCPAGSSGRASSLLNDEVPIRFAGVIKNLSVFMGLDQFQGEYACHVDGVDTALSVISIGSGTGQVENTTDRVVVGAASEIAHRVSVSSGSGTNRYSNRKYEFEPAGAQTISHMYGTSIGGGPTLQNNDATEFINIIGRLDENGGQDNNQTRFIARAGGTWSTCFVNVASTTRSTDSFVNSRVNGIDGNMSVTMTGGMTGLFEDASNNDTFVAADELNWTGVTQGGGGNMVINQISSFLARDVGCWELTPWNTFGANLNSGLTRDNVPGGNWDYAGAGTFWQIPARTKQAFQQYETQVDLNGTSVLSTGYAYLKINDLGPGASPSAVTIPGGQTGRFESKGQTLCEVGDFVTMRTNGGNQGGGGFRRMQMQCLRSPEINNPVDIFWAPPVTRVEGGTR